MSTYGIVTDERRCISCKACEVHCKVKNAMPVGIRLGVHFTDGPAAGPGSAPVYRTLFMPCFHCEEPECVDACPSGAMTRRETDGIVYIVADDCIGCGACMEACPWHIPQWSQDGDKAVKCDLCRDRIDAGLKPACVTGCTAHALSLVSQDDPRYAKQRKRAPRRPVAER